MKGMPTKRSRRRRPRPKKPMERSFCWTIREGRLDPAEVLGTEHLKSSGDWLGERPAQERAWSASGGDRKNVKPRYRDHRHHRLLVRLTWRLLQAQLCLIMPSGSAV